MGCNLKQGLVNDNKGNCGKINLQVTTNQPSVAVLKHGHPNV